MKKVLLLILGSCFFLTSCSNQQKYYNWAINGNYQELKKALDNKLNPNIQDKWGTTLLFCASEYGHENLVALLLEKGADINLPTNTGITPLMATAISGRTEMLKSLIEKNAKINTVDRFGKTALMYGARPKNSDKVLAILLDNGVDINSVDNLGKSALFWAVQDNNDKSINFLISKGINVNLISKAGDNALMYYLSGDESKKKEIVELFIKAGIDLKAQSKNKETALDMALTNGNEEIIALIQNALEKQKKIETKK